MPNNDFPLLVGSIELAGRIWSVQIKKCADDFSEVTLIAGRTCFGPLAMRDGKLVDREDAPFTRDCVYRLEKYVNSLTDLLWFSTEHVSE